jgi:hypothetical protein
MADANQLAEALRLVLAPLDNTFLTRCARARQALAAFEAQEEAADDLQALLEARAMLSEIGLICREQTRFVGSYAEIVRQAFGALAQAAMSPKQTSGTPEPVAWQYRGEPWFDGNKWQETVEVTTSEVVARWKDKDCRPLYAAPVAQAEPWVSVTERLPDHKGGYFDTTPCLLAWDDGTVESGWYCGQGSFQHANGDMDYHEEAKVTHWMPLPQPPKEGA